MFKKKTFVSLIIMMLFSGCSNNEDLRTLETKSLLPNQTEKNDTRAQILNAYTDLQKKSGWWVVPRSVSAMTIYAEVKNAETVLFWKVPGGTETWGERTLIGFDKDGSDGWSIKWEFGNQTFHDYIYIQALGNDSSSLANETIQITSEDDE
ncbi:hypothetical protein [Cohnella panacarvi]|uniref:hypothetical protein n=1 Tax=Cohnella panacarvi TaxID=400776 RepID=UPI000478DA20|nr:hypothetical protein [Cohnella panacarvi]